MKKIFLEKMDKLEINFWKALEIIAEKEKECSNEYKFYTFHPVHGVCDELEALSDTCTVGVTTNLGKGYGSILCEALACIYYGDPTMLLKDGTLDCDAVRLSDEDRDFIESLPTVYPPKPEIQWPYFDLSDDQLRAWIEVMSKYPIWHREHDTSERDLKGCGYETLRQMRDIPHRFYRSFELKELGVGETVKHPCAMFCKNFICGSGSTFPPGWLSRQVPSEKTVMIIKDILNYFETLDTGDKKVYVFDDWGGDFFTQGAIRSNLSISTSVSYPYVCVVGFILKAITERYFGEFDGTTPLPIPDDEDDDDETEKQHYDEYIKTISTIPHYESLGSYLQYYSTYATELSNEKLIEELTNNSVPILTLSEISLDFSLPTI